jgi:hypothetical protein
VSQKCHEKVTNAVSEGGTTFRGSFTDHISKNPDGGNVIPLDLMIASQRTSFLYIESFSRFHIYTDRRILRHGLSGTGS